MQYQVACLGAKAKLWMSAFWAVQRMANGWRAAKAPWVIEDHSHNVCGGGSLLLFKSWYELAVPAGARN